MWGRMLLLILILLLALPLYTVLSGEAPLGRDFRTADRSSMGIAPRAESTPEAVVQVYFARALNWRGIFGVHAWVATKAENAHEYMIHHVIGWRMYRGLPVVSSGPGIPDGRWFGNDPTLIVDLRGEAAHCGLDFLRAGDPVRVLEEGPGLLQVGHALKFIGSSDTG